MLNARPGAASRRTIATLGHIAQDPEPRPEQADPSHEVSDAEAPRTASGLGRGLAGILGDALASTPSAGVGQLVGATGPRRSPEVRQLVTTLALETLAEGVGADGVVLVRRDPDGDLATVTSRLPSGWTALSPVGFEVVGRLHRHLDASGTDCERNTVGPHHFLLCRHPEADGVMAAAVVRSTPFSDHEVRVVGTLVRSVGAALSEPEVSPVVRSLRVVVENATDGVLASVRLADGDRRSHAAVVAGDGAEAVARAAAELCDPPVQVSFAGEVEVDGELVAVVVVTDPAGAPLFGLAVGDPNSPSGPADAVFAAARLAGVSSGVAAAEHP